MSTIASRLILRSGCNASGRTLSPTARSNSTSTTTTTTTSNDASSQTCQLSDGRTLGFSEFGNPRGTPVFFFHGVPDSRAAIRTTHTLAERLNIRFIGIDRPGIGLSTFYPNRKVTDWVSDFQQLTQHVGIDRYRILSVSGGTGYALACAKAIPKENLRSVGVTVGIGPWEAGTKGMSLVNRIGLNLWAYSLTHAWMSRLIAGSAIPLAQDPDQTKFRAYLNKNLKYFNEADRKELSKPEEFELLVDTFREVWRQGIQGHAQEYELVTSHWGFDLEDIKYDNIKFWYGAEDVNCPPRFGEYMAQRLPNAKLKVYPEVSHFTFWWKHIEEVLNELLEDD